MLSVPLAVCVAAAHLAAPNVVFLSVDTLRADHLGCYGYPLDTSPNIDALVREGLRFDDCLSEVPITSPSFCSMITSRYPRTTGTTRNGLPMPAHVPTVAEGFRGAGYATFCVQSNWTLKADLCGLDRGFDTYEDGFHKKRWGFLKSERYADEVTDIAIELLEARDPSRPFFCWIHYSDPHAPYRFHKAFHPAQKKLRKMDEVAQVRARYDSEIAFTDHHLGRLLDALPRENTFVLFVADHGESLHEHDYLGHGRRIYQTGVHIPLAIRGPGITAGVEATPARGIDVGPTLLGLAGLGRPPGMLGMDLLHDAVPADRARVIETYGGAVPKLPGARAVMTARPPMRQGVTRNEWKLILRGPRTELFNVREDPMEETNLAGEMEARVRELTTLVETWSVEHPEGSAEEAELDQDDLEALEALGYLE